MPDPYYTPQAGLPTLTNRARTPRGLVDQGGYYNSPLPKLGTGGTDTGGNYYTPKPPIPMFDQLKNWETNLRQVAAQVNPQGMGGGAPKPKTWRDVGHAQINSKLGQGWAERFQQAHGMSPLDFYTDKRNWFSYQRDAAMDYGTDSKEFANATIRATIDEGMKHQQEAAMWQQLHGNVEIPPEVWEHWYYGNRNGFGDRPIVW